DYDGDGDVDLAVTNYGEPDRLYRNDLPPGNHWIHIDLEGTVSSRSAIGARIRIVTAGGSQIREIGGNHGFWSHNSFTVEFGLGTHATVDSVLVRWPRGVRQELFGVPGDQRITIIEGGWPVDAGIDSGLPSRFALHAGAPNPFRGTTAIRYDVPKPVHVGLRIYDVTGRLVSLLVDRDHAPGRYVETWNGTNESGKRVASGIYLYRLHCSEYDRVRKLILVR
ncbi:ASPIC/UnbV domain-containing protein, partial [bacterium]|nr:ASPIC/UnbV domain-containing protein [bacterium]